MNTIQQHRHQRDQAHLRDALKRQQRARVRACVDAWGETVRPSEEPETMSHG